MNGIDVTADFVTIAQGIGNAMARFNHMVTRRREALRQRELAATRQMGYEELKLITFGLTVGVALMWAAKR